MEDQYRDGSINSTRDEGNFQNIIISIKIIAIHSTPILRLTRRKVLNQFMLYFSQNACKK
jgi:hypothetical protein